MEEQHNAFPSKDELFVKFSGCVYKCLSILVKQNFSLMFSYQYKIDHSDVFFIHLHPNLVATDGCVKSYGLENYAWETRTKASGHNFVEETKRTMFPINYHIQQWSVWHITDKPATGNYDGLISNTPMASSKFSWRTSYSIYSRCIRFRKNKKFDLCVLDVLCSLQILQLCLHQDLFLRAWSTKLFDAVTLLALVICCAINLIWYTLEAVHMFFEDVQESSHVVLYIFH